MPKTIPSTIRSIVERLQTEGSTADIRAGAEHFLRAPDALTMTKLAERIQADDSPFSRMHYAELGTALMIEMVLRR